MMILMDIIIPAYGDQLDDALGSHYQSIPDMVLPVMHEIYTRFISPLNAQRSNSQTGTGKQFFR